MRTTSIVCGKTLIIDLLNGVISAANFIESAQKYCESRSSIIVSKGDFACSMSELKREFLTRFQLLEISLLKISKFKLKYR